jgi:hypothetical protein
MGGGGGQETSGAAGTNAGAMGIYDPNYNYGGGALGMDQSRWNQIGTGFQTFGQAYAQGQQAPQFSAPAPYNPTSISGAQEIPYQAPQQQDSLVQMMALLQRLGILGGGGGQY